MSIVDFTYDDVTDLVSNVYNKLKFKNQIDLIVAVGRGGFIPAVCLSHKLDLKNMTACFIDTYCSDNSRRTINDINTDRSKMPDIGDAKNILVVDDIVDSGQTLDVLNKWIATKYPEITCQYACLVYKPSVAFSDVIYGFEHRGDSWVKFPWEV